MKKRRGILQTRQLEIVLKVVFWERIVKMRNIDSNSVYQQKNVTIFN